MTYVKMAVISHTHDNWTSEFVLERDEKGEPVKVVRAGEPVDLSAEQQKQLEQEFGVTFDKSSKQEYDAFQGIEDSSPAGDDVAGAAPVMGTAQLAGDKTTTDKNK